jgi:hypothetical protein
VLRFLVWRLLGLLAVLASFALIAWFLDGGPGRALRGHTASRGVDLALPALASLAGKALELWRWAPGLGLLPAPLALALALAAALLLAIVRVRARGRRRYVRLRIDVYRTDHARAEDILRMFGALHKQLLQRWWLRLLRGQPSLSLEAHCTGGAQSSVWLAIACPEGAEQVVQSVLQASYPNCRLRAGGQPVGVPPVVLRLKKHAEFIKRLNAFDEFERRLR